MTESEAKAAGEILALVEWKPGDREWCHVSWREADGEGPMWDDGEVVTRYWPEGWVTKGGNHVTVDLDAKVVAFAPLPEVEL